MNNPNPSPMIKNILLTHWKKSKRLKALSNINIKLRFFKTKFKLQKRIFWSPVLIQFLKKLKDKAQFNRKKLNHSKVQSIATSKIFKYKNARLNVRKILLKLDCDNLMKLRYFLNQSNRWWRLKFAVKKKKKSKKKKVQKNKNFYKDLKVMKVFKVVQLFLQFKAKLQTEINYERNWK